MLNPLVLIQLLHQDWEPTVSVLDDDASPAQTKPPAKQKCGRPSKTAASASDAPDVSQSHQSSESLPHERKQVGSNTVCLIYLFLLF
jgi:hypothetical protein